MKNLPGSTALAALLLFTGLPALSAPPAPEIGKLVTVADVEKVTGLKGIAVIDGGALNEKTVGSLLFMKGSSLVANVFLFKAGTFAADKAHAVAGIGDEAFEANNGLAVTFRKGSVPAMVLGTAPQIKPDQVRALAKVIAGRM